MGPSMDDLSVDSMCTSPVPIIKITAPTSPTREAPTCKYGISNDLETIQECSTNSHQTESPLKHSLGNQSLGNLLPSNQSAMKLLLPNSTRKRSLSLDQGEEQLSDSEELDKLKTMATRLRLCTRRPSYVEWCNNLPKIQDFNGNMRKWDEDDDEDDKTNLKERHRVLEEKIQWVRKELREMKSQDHRLAIQLMRIRSEIQQLKLQKSCHEHRELIDTATECAKEDREPQPAMCDLPFRENGLIFALEKPLKDVGVTKLNLFARRFSLS